MTQNQALNRWFYFVAVSRTQTKVQRVNRAYFLYHGGDNIIAEVKVGDDRCVEKLQDIHFDEDWIYCQVAKDIYCLENVYNDFCKLANGGDGYFEMQECAFMLNDRFGPAMCNFKETYIFVTGGLARRSVERYSIMDNTWQIMPELRQERHFHSSVAIHSAIYVFCGQGSSDNYTNSIERLDCSNDDIF